MLISPVRVPATAPRAGLRAWVGLAVLFLPTVLFAIDGTVLGFALPAISADLRPSATTLLWIVDAYPLVLAALLVTMGTVGDRIGRRALLLLGAAGFGVVSLGAAFATTPAQLLAARALLGVFGAMLMPATLALLRGLFLDRAQRRLAVAVWATGFAAGAALGPVVGGVLLAHSTWHAIFLINVPVLVILLISAPLLLPESRRADPGPIDGLGVVLSLGTMAPAVLALKTLAHDGFTATAVGSAVLAVVSGVLFVRRAHARVAAGHEPLLDLTLFASPVLRLSALANAATMFAHTGMVLLGTQYLLLVADVPALNAGLLLIPAALVTVVCGLLAAPLGRRLPLRVLVAVGLGLVAAGLLAGLALPATGHGGVLVLVVATVLLGAGVGLSETTTNEAILSAAPAERAGAASAVSETAYEIGAVAGAAVLGSVLSAGYRAGVSVPSGLGADAAIAAGETLGGAAAAASALSADAGAALLVSAREAFVAGGQLTAVVGGAVVAAVATLVVVTLRPRKPRRS